MITSFDKFRQLESPDMYLCNPDGRQLCVIKGDNRHVVLRLNDLSELTFTATKPTPTREYDIEIAKYSQLKKEAEKAISDADASYKEAAQEKNNPIIADCVIRINKAVAEKSKLEALTKEYNLLESKRNIFVDGLGWFQIVSATEDIDGDLYTKNITCESLQTIFKNRNFVSEERVYMFYNPNDEKDSNYSSEVEGAIPSVVGQLSQQLGINVAIQGSGYGSDTEVTEDYDNWTIVWIDPALRFLSQSATGSQMYASASANNVCRSFKKESLNGYDFIINKVQQAFGVLFEFDFLHKAIKVKFDQANNGNLSPSNIYLSKENLIKTLNIQENANDIVTVMACNGGDLDIRTVNPMGTNYIVDFSYYKGNKDGDGKYPWMSRGLTNVLNSWETTYDSYKNATGAGSFSDNVNKLQAKYAEIASHSSEEVYANRKVIDLEAVRDENLKNDENKLGFTIVETVKIGEKSLHSNSAFIDTAFSDSFNTTGYKKAPKYIRNSDKSTEGTFVFPSDAENEAGSISSFISNYEIANIEDKEDENEPTAFFYFIDDTNARSYCKIKLESVVSAVKDKLESENSDTVAKNILLSSANSIGYVTLFDLDFKITYNNGEYTVTTAAGTTVASNVTNYFNYNGRRYKINGITVGESAEITTVTCCYVGGFERYTANHYVNEWIALWNAKANSCTAVVQNLRSEASVLENANKVIADACNILKYVKNYDTTNNTDYCNELLNYWIEGEYTNDNYSLLDSDGVSDEITLAKQLMADGEKDLAKSCQPKFTMTIDAVDFTKIPEFQEFSNELKLGTTITIERDDDIHYQPALISIEMNLDDADAFSLGFANSGKLNETAMTFADLIKQASSTSKTVSTNWSQIMEYAKNSETITSLINDPLDKTLSAARTNMQRQEFVSNSAGLTGRQFNDDSETTYSPEQIKLLNNILMFTDDNWETIKTAIGKIKKPSVKEDNTVEYTDTYGLIADVLMGNIVLTKDVQILNEGGSILLNDNGITVKTKDEKGVFQPVFLVNTETGECKFSPLDKAVSDTETRFSEIIADVDNFKSVYGKKITTAEGTLKEHSTTIEQNADKITLEATARENGDNEIKGMLELYVNKENMTTVLNAMADEINFGSSSLNIDSNRIKINSDNFSLTSDGTITAKAGYIGGWELTQKNRFGGTYLMDDGTGGTDRVGAVFDISNSQRAYGQIIFGIGLMGSNIDNEKFASCRFHVKADGRMYAANSTLDTGDLTGTWEADAPIAVTSDRDKKHDIEVIDERYSILFDNLHAIRHKYDNGTSNRYHTGFIAQDVEQAIMQAGLTTQEFAGLINNNGEYSLRYSEFICLCVDEIQKLKKRVAAQEEQILQLEQQLQGLQGEINETT